MDQRRAEYVNSCNYNGGHDSGGDRDDRGERKEYSN